MNNLSVPYHIAKLAKERGFDEPSIYSYYEDKSIGSELNLIDYNQSKTLISAPFYQQIIDWFRDKYDIFISHDIRIDDNKVVYYFMIKFINQLDREVHGTNGYLTPIHMNLECPVSNPGFDDYYVGLNKTLEETFKLI